MKYINMFLVSGLMLSSVAAYSDPAIIITDSGCGMLDGDGNFTSATDVHSVNSVNGKGGNIMLKCSVKGVANSTGAAVKWDYDSTGTSCNTLYGATTDWSEVVSASGNATLICRIHHSDS
ncbi:MAG: hypothetical protein ACI89U_000809 [Gammaproteobacteria bacterium]|jgi:hypothetical protein